MTALSRHAGRGAAELRPLSFETDYILYPEGSVLATAGRTKVLCNASVEAGVPAWMASADHPGGWVTAEYALLPRATHQRRSRERLRPRGRTQEIRRLIGRSLRAGLHLTRMPPITVTIDCDVLQADGGTRTLSITGGYLALALALGRSVEAGGASRDVYRAPVAAVSVGMVAGRPLLDLDYEEDSSADVDANIVMNDHGDFIEVQTTAEGRQLTRDDLDALLELAEKGCRSLLEEQSRVLTAASPVNPFDGG